MFVEQTLNNAHQHNMQPAFQLMDINLIKQENSSSCEQKHQFPYSKVNKNQQTHSSNKKQRKTLKIQHLTEWTSSNQKKLSQLHNLYGNKWLQISQILQKTDNQVKNHYHSRLRSTLRKLNKYIFELNLNFKPLKKNIISKILHISQLFLSSKNKTQKSRHQQAYYLKNKMFEFNQLVITQQNIQQLTKNTKQFIQQLIEFNKDKKKQIRSKTLKADREKYLIIKKSKIQEEIAKNQENYEQMQDKNLKEIQHQQPYCFLQQKSVNTNLFQNCNYPLSPFYHHYTPLYYTLPIANQPTLSQYPIFQALMVSNQLLNYQNILNQSNTYFWMNQIMP